MKNYVAIASRPVFNDAAIVIYAVEYGVDDSILVGDVYGDTRKTPHFPVSATMFMVMLILCTMDGGSIYGTICALIIPINFSPVFSRVFRLKKPYSMNKKI